MQIDMQVYYLKLRVDNNNVSNDIKIPIWIRVASVYWKRKGNIPYVKI